MGLMRAYRWPVVVLIGLFAFVPFAAASTYESWTDGIYDAETDYLLQVAKCPEAAIKCAPVEVARYVRVVAAVAGLGDHGQPVVEPLESMDLDRPPVPVLGL